MTGFEPRISGVGSDRHNQWVPQKMYVFANLSAYNELVASKQKIDMIASAALHHVNRFSRNALEDFHRKKRK